MKKISRYLSALFILVCCAWQPAYAGKPACSSSYGGYCYYDGYVSRIYVNASGLILLYYDTLFDSEQSADVAGFSISSSGRHAAAVVISENPEFAKLFYSTALSAQATKRKISIQMRNTTSGYLKADRIWLAEE
ncbi:hypothetical protein KFE80_06110 [bacterium SCSIO 12696]|nr:hypothetical protein KFE80_06110 [bacterium SCSIO 12696]